ncbi:arylsulfatase A [Catalinimonas alkaloidigena]|uniref:sulfatase family protein n=1 Tax=Catalinimonas alkaloidigena TaxID=1075417 RepID=UPI0024054338|nr:arylsulfatase [Catalinimonas alkaloidigena]MDF9799323.1 arylsulfatase A [Catalinimonas alkaloidigena]
MNSITKVFRGHMLLALIISACTSAVEKPNIIIILADDMGYGDLSCYNQEAKFQTPNIDKLASEGMLFTDAHSPSAVCTPTRYSILTGRYAWRSRLKEWVLWEWDPPLIAPELTTLPAFLKHQSYHTSAIGKWHLGWNWPTTDTISAKETNGKNVDYGQAISGGPLSYGFDYYFGDDVPNFPPYTFIENNKVMALPTEDKPGTMFGKAGKMAAGWKLEHVMPEITRKAVEYIHDKKTETDQPFFLYFALTAPHTPIVPTADFKDKSNVGPYGDFVLEVDWSVGQIVEALEQSGQRENTIIFFTSDNGSPARDGTSHSGPIGSVIANFGHHPNGKLRGLKADIWEGGHRVPFLVNWKGHIGEGTVNNYPVSSIDLFPTIADLLEKPFSGDEKAGKDSYSLLPLLQGNEDDTLRNRSLIHHSGAGVFAIRKGPWKLILSDVSGGFSDHSHPDGYGIETPGQLYNLDEDISEKENLYDRRPDIVNSLLNLLDKAQQ